MRLRSLLVTAAFAVAACSAPGTVDPAPEDLAASPAEPSRSASPARTPRAAGRPAQLVAITTGHQLVVVDAASGEVVRVLAEGDDPDDFGGEGEEPSAAGAFLDSVAVDQSGGLVWFPICCEPAPGALHTVPLGGGEHRAVGAGYDPALHPDADLVAVVEMQWVSILDSRGRIKHRFAPSAAAPMQISKPSWSPDGRTIAFEFITDNRGEPEIHLLPADAEGMDAARRVPAAQAKAPWRSPVFDGSGALWVLEQSAGPDSADSARLRLDPATGEVLQRRDLPGEVVRQTYDRSGTHLLMVLAGGELLWESDGKTQRVPGSFVSAAW